MTPLFGQLAAASPSCGQRQLWQQHSLAQTPGGDCLLAVLISTQLLMIQMTQPARQLACSPLHVGRPVCSPTLGSLCACMSCFWRQQLRLTDKTAFAAGLSGSMLPTLLCSDRADGRRSAGSRRGRFWELRCTTAPCGAGGVCSRTLLMQ